MFWFTELTNHTRCDTTKLTEVSNLYYDSYGYLELGEQMKKNGRWVSIQDVVTALEYTANVVRGMCERGEITGAHRPGRIWHIPRIWLESELKKLEVSQ